jgi:molybdate transport system substrate-binding protein
MSRDPDTLRFAGGSRFARHARRVSRFRYRQWVLLAVVACALLLPLSAGCGGDEGQTRLTVLAASSLTTAFDELEATYEDEHPDVDVRLSYDSSAILAEQVIAGAPADVLATADTITMQDVIDADLVDGEPSVFVQNTLVIATPADNPAGIQEVTDLTDAAVAVCVPEAPCGNASQELLQLNGVDLDPATEEDNVSSVLTKVTSGEVDAGLVYVTDAQAAGDDVHTVEIANSDEVVNDYPIAVLADSDNTEAAQDWVDLVLSPDGQEALAGLGFRPVS